MKALRRLRALARVELRQLMRNKARSTLVVTLIALPVAALVAGSIVVRVIERSPDERAARVLGSADVRVEGDAAAIAPVLSLLPAGARVDRFASSPERVVVRGLSFAATRCVFDADGSAAAMFHVVQGRLPSAPDEVGLSPILLEAAALRLGDAVTLASRSTSGTVVGVLQDPDDLRRALVAVATDPAGGLHRMESQLIALPRDADPEHVAAALRACGARVRTRCEILATTDSIAPAIFVLGSLGFVEAALIVGAAFAIGLRRRQREVGLLAATGAGAGDIVVSHLVSAAVLACAGGALGAALGVGVAAQLYPYLDGWTGKLSGAFELPVPQVVGAIALGVVTAVASTWLPARGAVRLPIRVALSGRRPLPPPARPWLVVGIVLVALGLGLVVIAPHVEGGFGVLANLGGAVSGVLGFGACSGWLLDRLARGAARLSLAWRLAVRDAGRHRSRNGPVVTAILAGVALSVTTASILASIEVSDGGAVGLRGDEVAGPRTLSRVVLLLSLLVGLSVIAAATALTAAESRADQQTLLAVGATPRHARAHAAARAAFLALLGCALAVPAGLLPALGTTASVSDLDFVVPWSEIAAVTLGLPLLAYLGAWCFARPAVWARST